MSSSDYLWGIVFRKKIQKLFYRLEDTFGFRVIRKVKLSEIIIRRYIYI